MNIVCLPYGTFIYRTNCINTPSFKVLNILIVEDVEENRYLLKAYLKKEPHCIDFAGNGKVALELYKANSYDMVFMDIQMPIMDGYEATKLIREYETSICRALSSW